MFTLPPKRYLSIIALTGIIAFSGCGGSSKDKDDEQQPPAKVDTSNLKEEVLRDNIHLGITRGFTSNSSAIASVAGNSKVFGSISKQASPNGLESGRLSTQRRINGSISLSPNDFTGGLSSSGLDGFKRMIDFSTINQDKNVYNFDPNEAQVCADPAGTNQAEISTAEELANCEAILAHITFEVTVTKMENDKVTAATTLFKYDNEVFAKTGFSDTTGYYEILLSGLRPLLLGINEVSTEEDKINIPMLMQGSVRVDFTAPTEKSGSFKVSIPNTLKIKSDTVGDEIQIDLAKTSQLLSVATDSDANSIELVLGLNGLNFLITDKDTSGNSYPVELALSALTGKVATSNNGDKLRVVGLSAEGVKFKVDNLDAMMLSLKPLDAMIDSSGNKTMATLSKLLALKFSQTNVRHYFNENAPTTDTLMVEVDADSGTSLKEFAENIIQVTTGNFSINVSGIEDAFNVKASAGNCLSNGFELIECPAEE